METSYRFTLYYLRTKETAHCEGFFSRDFANEGNEFSSFQMLHHERTAFVPTTTAPHLLVSGVVAASHLWVLNAGSSKDSTNETHLRNKTYVIQRLELPYVHSTRLVDLGGNARADNGFVEECN